MATKLAKSTAHAAGIYADMSVDGPEIGTLVVVVDRARHLPNRKTVGKQDPYCAARLGKEAKKTTTDKRGGQTPRWDQELRFTVYDSSDYHKLKVSLFNDDKKCDLIGEAWIQLSDILTPGGGQSDSWHPLTWKGKYAGEVQLELTFWDLRPRQDSPPPKESSRSAARADSAPEGVGGPRGLPRRPLPAEPAPPVRAQSEQPQPPQARSFGPRDLHAEQTRASPQVEQVRANAHAERHSLGGHETNYGYGSDPRRRPEARSPYHQPQQIENDPEEMYLWQEPQQQQQADYQSHINGSQRHPHDYEMPPQNESYAPSTIDGGFDLPELPPLAPRPQRQQAPQQVRHYSATDRDTTAEYTLPHYSSPAPSRSIEPLRPVSHESATSPQPLGRGSPGRPYIEQPEPQALLDSPPPPPPPTHRVQSFPVESQALLSYGEPQHYGPGAGRQALTAEALSDPSIDDELYMHISGTETQLSTRSAPLPDGRSEAHSLPRRLSGYGMVGGAGYERDVPPPSEHGHPAQLRYEHRRSAQTNAYQTPPRRPGQQAMRHHASTVFETPVQNSRPGEANMHHASVPLVKPQALAPEHRNSIPRKSISPAGSPGDTDGLGGVAFSPDSFDVLNPNLRAAKGINDLTPKYDTPESIREAARERQKAEELERGPIVDSAGKVIDPTDHLPSDTWAPEPEKKTPRKTHEVKIKFRHHTGASPQGGMQHRPSPQPRPDPRPYYTGHAAPSAYAPSMHGGQAPAPLRAHPMAQPAHHSSPAAPPALQPSSHAYADEYTPEEISPTGRNRLQKRAPQGHVASSPGMMQTPPSAGPHHAGSAPGSGEYHRGYHGSPRYSQGAYGSPAPLREVGNPNYGYGGPVGGHGHRGSVGAPPVPAKVPLGHEQEDWGPPPSAQRRGHEAWADGGADRLSMEIGAIDIGPGGGRGARRRR